MQPVRVEVLVPHAAGSIAVLTAGEHALRFEGLSSGGVSHSDMKLTVRASERAVGSDGPPPERPDTATLAQTYVHDHLLKDRLTDVLTRLLVEQPEDPVTFLSAALRGLPALAKPVAGEAAPAEEAATREQRRTSLPIAAMLEEATADPLQLHFLPHCVVPGRATWLMDFGSGETGFHTYDATGTGLKYRGQKIKDPLFPSFVETNRIEEFCQVVVDEFKLMEAEAPEIDIFGGATGLHRELMSQEESVQKARVFFEEVETRLSAMLGKRTSIRLFVPSGLLEAQLELYATEWLVCRGRVLDMGEGSTGTASSDKAMTDGLIQGVFDKLDHSCTGELSAGDLNTLLSGSEAAAGVGTAVSKLIESKSVVTLDVFQESLVGNVSLQLAVQALAFTGTLSVGGGSSQLAMSGSSCGALQLFSVPVGNRVPTVEGLFSKPVQEGERESWATRVRSDLKNANFPRGVRGLYVGISAAYHAVKAAGAADQMIGLNAVRAALASTLEKLCPLKQTRDIANLVLIHELLGWVFDETACFIFKRNWAIPDGEFVATWTLGLFTQQHRSVAAAAGQPNPPALLRICTSSSAICSNQQRSETMFEVPYVVSTESPTHLLDFGSGEIGVYCYGGDVAKGDVQLTRDCKIKKPLFEGYVSGDCVNAFADMLAQELKFGPAPPGADASLVIAGGATGLHREMLVGDQEKRDIILGFFGRVEAELGKRLGRRVCINIFVPSGELEAQFELRAVEWLIGLASVEIPTGGLQPWMLNETFSILSAAGASDEETHLNISRAGEKLKNLGVRTEEVIQSLQRADTDGGGTLDRHEFVDSVLAGSPLECLVRRCTFGGTISAGGGSCQLTLSGSMQNTTPQLFSIPVGNRLPIVQNLFSETVTMEERVDWIERIRDALDKNRFPRNMCGLYVGISAMYHAAVIAGINDRVVSCPEAVAALAAALADVDSKDHRKVANLVLVKTVIDWVFDDKKACLLFKRNWSSEGNTYVAGWVLGWYVTQLDACCRELAV